MMLGFPKRQIIPEPYYNQFYETDEFDGDRLQSKWSPVNFSVDTFSSVSNGSVCVKTSSGSTGIHSRMLLQTITDPTWKVITRVSFFARGEESEYAGLTVRDSGSGKMENIYIINVSNLAMIQTSRFDSANSFGANTRYERAYTYSVYLGIELTDANLIFSYSYDGISWRDLESHSKTASLSTIDQVGLIIDNTNNTTYDVQAYWDFFRRIS